MQEFFCRLYGATYPLGGVDQARYDMFERKHQALERLTLTEGAVELQVGLSNSLYAETRPPIIWTGKNRCGWVEIWVDG